jgi:hypothetical protein
MWSHSKAVLAFGRAVLTVFCEFEFVLRAQTRIHAFPMSVGNKTDEVLFTPTGLRKITHIFGDKQAQSTFQITFTKQNKFDCFSCYPESVAFAG